MPAPARLCPVVLCAVVPRPALPRRPRPALPRRPRPALPRRPRPALRRRASPRPAVRCPVPPRRVLRMPPPGLSLPARAGARSQRDRAPRTRTPHARPAHARRARASHTHAAFSLRRLPNRRKSLSKVDHFSFDWGVCRKMVPDWSGLKNRARLGTALVWAVKRACVAWERRRSTGVRPAGVRPAGVGPAGLDRQASDRQA
jgi:hypothetical protein